MMDYLRDGGKAQQIGPVEKNRICELFLFGSRAKGVFTDKSDIDIAYTLTGCDAGETLAYDIIEATTWESELQLIVSPMVQLHMADPLTDAIVWPAVRAHGQLIYSKLGQLPLG
ncbi:nucleotidyltransferase family protein [Novosphingobium colocasiae]